MLEKQSLDEFLSNINNGKTVIVSLSPQSRASIAVHYGLSPLQVNSFILSAFHFLYESICNEIEIAFSKMLFFSK